MSERYGHVKNSGQIASCSWLTYINRRSQKHYKYVACKDFADLDDKASRLLA